jgi:hypothetical protein
MMNRAEATRGNYCLLSIVILTETQCNGEIFELALRRFAASVGNSLILTIANCSLITFNRLNLVADACNADSLNDFIKKLHYRGC